MMMQSPDYGMADLHMHTTASDGFAPVKEMLDYVAARGMLDVIAITDHDVLDASLWAYEHRADYPFDIVPGVEVSSLGGHILALWVSKPIPQAMSMEETVAAIHEQGGLAVIAHPFEIMIHPAASWRYFRQPQVLQMAKMDAVEVHNSGAPTPGGNWVSRRLARKTQLPIIGSSDAHTVTAIGCGITYFEGRSALDLRRAIQNGQTSAGGRPWPIIDYLRLLPTLIRGRSSASLGTSMP